MTRYIDFEVAREYLHKACASIGSNGGAMLKIKFDEQPTADVKPVVHGEWLNGYKRQTCSVCRYRGMRSWNYCPNCGAEMEIKKGDKNGI